MNRRSREPNSPFLNLTPIQFINKFGRCFLKKLSRIWLLLITSISTTEVQATIIPHLDCYISLLLSTLSPVVYFLHSSQSPVSNQCFPVTPRIKPKSIRRPCTIRDPQLPLRFHLITFFPLLTALQPQWCFCIMSKCSCPQAGTLGLVFSLSPPLFLQCFLTLFRSLLKCHFLRKLFSGYLM